MLLYKVVEKLVQSDRTITYFWSKGLRPDRSINFLGYKITAGLSVFYITEELYQAGVDFGVIEPIKAEVPEVDIELFYAAKGREGVLRLMDALQTSSIPFLRDSLNRINEGPKTVFIRVYETSNPYKVEKYLHQIVVDLEKREVLANSAADWQSMKTVGFLHIKTYDQFINRLAEYAYMRYMNSSSLYDEIRKMDFITDDFEYLRVRFEFSFE